MNKDRNGFTLIEMVVVAPIVILSIGAFLVGFMSLTGEAIATRAKTLLAYNVQDALEHIERNVKRSDLFLATNTITPLVSPQGYDNNIENFVNVDLVKGDVLIIQQSATTNNTNVEPGELLYLKDQPNACGSPSIRDNTPLTINVVYFVKNSTLWQRTIMPSNYASVGCTNPWQQPSCEPNYSNSFCKADDVELVKGVTPSDFVVRYFESASSTVPNATASNPSASTAARNTALESLQAARVTIHAATTAAGRDVVWEASVLAIRQVQ